MKADSVKSDTHWRILFATLANLAPTIMSGKPQKTAKKVAIPAGFEPATLGFEVRYSIQLNYGTVFSKLSVFTLLKFVF